MLIAYNWDACLPSWLRHQFFREQLVSPPNVWRPMSCVLAIVPKLSTTFKHSLDSCTLMFTALKGLYAASAPTFLPLLQFCLEHDGYLSVSGTHSPRSLSSCYSPCLESSFPWFSHTCLFLHSHFMPMLKSQEALPWPSQNQSAHHFLTRH